METDFLNFHDEEHFGSALYQNDLLDDSQSSLLDIVGDDYSRHEAREYIDHSIIWEQDVERELNGDVAVIPMSGQIDSFPKLSNSPPSKDFQKIFSDWQHLTAIETAPNEDLTVDLHLPPQGLVSDVLDCFNPSTITVPPQNVTPSTSEIKLEPVTIIPSFDFSNTTIPEVKPSFESLTKVKKKDTKPPIIRKTGGKNLELMKQVVKEELDLDSSFKSDINSSDELDSANDSFDITSYVNGDDPPRESKFEAKFDPSLQDQFETKPPQKIRQRTKKFGGAYEKSMPDEVPETQECRIKQEDIKVEEVKKENEDKRKSLHEDSEEDCIDVETVSEQMPVLQARDLTSLLEQFEASEAFNPKPQLPPNLFENSDSVKDSKPVVKTQLKEVKPAKLTSETKTVPEQKQKPPGDKNKLKSLEVKHQVKSGKQMRDSLPLELIQKIKASGAKKAISVIPAMPTKKARASQLGRSKLLKMPPTSCGNEAFQLDHDYCSVSPARFGSRRNSSDSERKFSSPDRTFGDRTFAGRKCEGKSSEVKDRTEQQKAPKAESSGVHQGVLQAEPIEDPLKKKGAGSIIDDTAIRIGKQIKNAIINENALKQKLKNQSVVKNSDGKLMVSLLKTNNRNLVGKINGGTIINTISTNDEQIQNIIVNESAEEKRNSKKRKLNLEEYKKLRGDIIKSSSSCDNSPGNSGANSPMPHSEKDKSGEKEKVEEKYQEIMMKMASEILKTNAKSKEVSSATSVAKLEEFIPPHAQKPSKLEEKEDKPVATPPKAANDNYKIKTIVSIGINTEESFLKTLQIAGCHPKSSQVKAPAPKIAFRLSKKKELQRNKFFDSSKSESEDSSPKKEPKKETGVDKSKLSEIITPILQNASSKINSNSLITNITATLLQQTQKPDPSLKMDTSSEMLKKIDSPEILKSEILKPQNEQKEEVLEHGEDKTVVIKDKSDEKPEMKTVGIQTDFANFEEAVKEKPARQYRIRRDSSASSTASVSSIKSKTSSNHVRKSTSHRQSHRTSSSNSISSSLGSRWSRSRSRSRSRSSSRSVYSHSSYSSDSSRSKSRSVSPSRRWHTDHNSRSRHRYSRSRRRSRSNYRSNYRRSRSPYSRSRSRRRRESAERERIREVEERRVIYVGKISDDTTKADLRRRFQNFGPITNVSVHFRNHGDNYGFVTFAYKMDAYVAVERGNDDPKMPKYDISFGGRRTFCKTKYSDLDNIEAETLNPASIFRREEDSFDILLREVQAKLRKRKV